VSSAAEPATATTISTGRTDVPAAWAAATATGTMTRTVAVLLMTWPSAAVSTKIATSSR
jgi:hypothetical protein